MSSPALPTGSIPFSEPRQSLSLCRITGSNGYELFIGYGPSNFYVESLRIFDFDVQQRLKE